MRINLISNFSAKGLTQDSAILRGLITNQFADAEIRKIQHYLPECPEAEINIFLELVNPALFISASRNIWIPNPEWTYKTWIPYMQMFDEIWLKTHEAYDIFQKHVSLEKLKYIGWTSIDKVFAEEKDYSKAIVLVGKNMYRNPKPILKAYYDIFLKDRILYEKLPELHIPYKKDEVQFFTPPELQDKVTLYGVISESEYDTLLNTCGLAICISTCEGFGHCVNEAMSSGCNLILSNIKPFRELTSVSLWGSELQYFEQPKCLGTLVDTSSQSIRSCLTTYTETSLKNKKKLSEQVRQEYEQRHRNFIGNFKIPNVPEFNLEKLFISESELPCISIVTLTYNRPEFIPLAKYSYLIQSYPADKLEWVIVNDGETIEEQLIGIPNVNYIQLDKKLNISEKRNIGVLNSMYSYICMMDDDDVYPNNSILARISMLLKTPEKECVFCTTIPCYDIEKKISFMNVPPITLEMSERVSEATLCFKKSFWNERNFHDEIAEGDKFIRGREQMCREISPQEVIVSLVHHKNISSRKITGEANGCHYGFCDELFLLVNEIGLKSGTSHGGGGESSCENDGGDDHQQEQSCQ
jgi:hypothetical protein